MPVPTIGLVPVTDRPTGVVRATDVTVPPEFASVPQENVPDEFAFMSQLAEFRFETIRLVDEAAPRYELPDTVRAVDEAYGNTDEVDDVAVNEGAFNTENMVEPLGAKLPTPPIDNIEPGVDVPIPRLPVLVNVKSCVPNVGLVVAP